MRNYSFKFKHWHLIIFCHCWQIINKDLIMYQQSKRMLNTVNIVTYYSTAEKWLCCWKLMQQLKTETLEDSTVIYGISLKNTRRYDFKHAYQYTSCCCNRSYQYQAFSGCHASPSIWNGCQVQVFNPGLFNFAFNC